MGASRAAVAQAVGLGLLALVSGGCVASSERAQEAAALRKNVTTVRTPFQALPATIYLSPGESVTVAVRGGKPPYMAGRNQAGLSIVEQPTTANGYHATIKAEAGTTRKSKREVFFEDSATNQAIVYFYVEVSLTVKPVRPDAASAPEGTDPVGFLVFGGEPPYKVTTEEGIEVVGPGQLDEPGVFQVKPKRDAVPGTYAGYVADARSRTEFRVTIAPLLRLTGVTHETLTVKQGERASFAIAGGTPTYTIRTSPETGLQSTGPDSSNRVEIKSDSAPGAYCATVRDSQGQEASIVIVVEKKPEAGASASKRATK